MSESMNFNISDYKLLGSELIQITHVRFLVFLAPTGAQERLMFVRSFGSNLYRALNLHLSNPDLKAISQSVILRAFHLESHPSEPIILRLVKFENVLEGS